jgi:hypothetical protein
MLPNRILALDRKLFKASKKAMPASIAFLRLSPIFSGADEGIRTLDLLFTKHEEWGLWLSALVYCS